MSALVERMARDAWTGAAVRSRDETPFGADQRRGHDYQGTAAATTPRHADAADDAQISSSALSSENRTAPSTKPLDRRLEPPMGAPEGRPRAERVRSTKRYLALARPTLVKRLCGHLGGLAAHAQTRQLVSTCSRSIGWQPRRWRLDDGFLDLLLATRNALVINNAWMRYTGEQVDQIQDVIRGSAEDRRERPRVSARHRRTDPAYWHRYHPVRAAGGAAAG